MEKKKEANLGAEVEEQKKALAAKAEAAKAEAAKAEAATQEQPQAAAKPAAAAIKVSTPQLAPASENVRQPWSCLQAWAFLCHVPSLPPVLRLSLAAQVDPKAVQALRKESGAGMMDCKKVLRALSRSSPAPLPAAEHMLWSCPTAPPPPCTELLAAGIALCGRKRSAVCWGLAVASSTRCTAAPGDLSMLSASERG